MPDERALPLEGIGIFQPQFVEFGGEERVILSLSRELHRQGRRHFVFCYRDQIDLARHAEWPLAVYQICPAGGPLARLRALRKAVRALQATRQPVPVLFNIQSAYHAGLAVNAPYHLRIPDTYSLLDPELGRTLKAKVSLRLQQGATGRGIRGASAFITNTAALRDEMQSLYGRRAEVIYLGGFGAAAAQPNKPACPPVQLLSVSRLQSSKRIDWMLRGLAELDRRGGPAWQLHVAGRGPEQAALEQLAASLGLAARVQFHGFVSDEQLAALYARCHVFLMPARQGFGLPAIEAIYQRMLVVLSEESGVIELLADTPWCVTAKAGEPAFAAALGRAVEQVAQGHDFSAPLPALPTEQEWAQSLVKACGW